MVLAVWSPEKLTILFFVLLLFFFSIRIAACLPAWEKQLIRFAVCVVCECLSDCVCGSLLFASRMGVGGVD